MIYTIMAKPKKYKRQFNIYEVINDIDDKIYIGATTTELWHRMSQHRLDARKGEKSPLYECMRKYGVEHFKIRLLANTEESNLREVEEIYIKKVSTDRLLNSKKSCIKDTSIHFDYNKIVEVYNMNGSKNKTAEIIGCSRPTVTKALRQLSNL